MTLKFIESKAPDTGGKQFTAYAGGLVFMVYEAWKLSGAHYVGVTVYREDRPEIEPHFEEHSNLAAGIQAANDFYRENVA